jgi:predicted Zn-ribbon and HTH transcriptional regulator
MRSRPLEAERPARDYPISGRFFFGAETAPRGFPMRDFYKKGTPMPTVRQRMIDLLAEEARDIRELSQLLRIREKEVIDHLDHIARTVAAQKRTLEVTPPVCSACGYRFRSRKKLKPPSRCPECKNERVEAPLYRVR